MARVLVACEFSGTVRDAFGEGAWSCDLRPASGNHLCCDVLTVLNDGWDLMIAHPPCTYLAISGARWFRERELKQREALEFVIKLMDAPIPRICIENPVSIVNSWIRKPDQMIQPWQFGHGETKKTCLWLKNLPCLRPTAIVEGRESRIKNMPDSIGRSRLRSITYPGIAKAMAQQWKPLL